MSLRDQQRVQNAVNYVIENLDSSLAIADVAQQVHVSEFHFHRIFKAETNEPFNQYVRRKRLERAYHCLTSAAPPAIGEVANSCGFSSPANFSKAFTAYFGFSPSAHQQGLSSKNSKKGKIFSKHGKDIAPASLCSGSLSAQDKAIIEKQIQRIEVVTIEEAHYCCIASTQGYNREGIQAAWQQLCHWLAQHDLPFDINKSVGFCWDNKWLTPEDVCRYECGYQIDNIAWAQERGIAARTRPAGRYLAVEYKGTLEQVELMYLWLLSEYLPKSNLALSMQYVVERYIELSCTSDVFHLEVLIKVN